MNCFVNNKICKRINSQKGLIVTSICVNIILNLYQIIVLEMVTFEKCPEWVQRPVLKNFKRLVDDFGMNESKFLQVAFFLTPHGVEHDNHKWVRQFAWQHETIAGIEKIRQQLWITPYAKTLVNKGLVFSRRLPNRGQNFFFTLTPKGFKEIGEKHGF